MGVDGRPSTGWKCGANGAKNAGSSSRASTRASSSGSRSSSGGSSDSHAGTGPLTVRNTVASITSSPRDRGHRPSQAAGSHARSFSGRSNLAGLRRVALNGWSGGSSGHLFGFGADGGAASSSRNTSILMSSHVRLGTGKSSILRHGALLHPTAGGDSGLQTAIATAVPLLLLPPTTTPRPPRA